MLEKLKFWDSPKPEAVEQPFEVGWYPDDYRKLEHNQFWNLFVYDDLMKGRKYHSFIADHSRHPDPTHPSVYTSQKYNFYFKDLGDGHSYPFALPEDFKPDAWLVGQEGPARIKGELWSVRPKAFISLDIHKQNGVQFVRQRVRITYPTTPISWSNGKPIPRILPDVVKTIDAWMYVGVPDYWKNRIGGIFQNQMQTYTHYPPKTWLTEFYKNDLK